MMDVWIVLQATHAGAAEGIIDRGSELTFFLLHSQKDLNVFSLPTYTNV